jgi:hypothetical protein
MKRRRLDVIQCVRLDPELADRLRAVAELERVSLSVMMRRVLAEHAWQPAIAFVPATSGPSDCATPCNAESGYLGYRCDLPERHDGRHRTHTETWWKQ